MDLVEALLGDAYFAKLPPKSTGHEYFGSKFFVSVRDQILARGGQADDVIATLTAFTAQSVADQAERFFPEPVERWILYGGGVWNRSLFEWLQGRLGPAPVETSAAHGIPVDALEAVAFAVLGYCAREGRPCNLPSATGATRRVVLGSLTPPG